MGEYSDEEIIGIANKIINNAEDCGFESVLIERSSEGAKVSYRKDWVLHKDYIR